MSGKIVTETDVNFLENVDTQFVSLVRYGAIQDGFRILKNHNGESNMTKKFYKLLAPSDVNEEKLNEIAEKSELSLEKKAEDELEGFYTFAQDEDENFDLENKELVSLDKDSNIYGIVAPFKGETEDEGVEKADLDYETVDSLAEAMFATMDIMLGTLRMPEASKANRRNTIISALDSLRKHVEATLKTAKGDDVLDLSALEVKGENLEELFYQVTTSDPDPEQEKAEKAEEIQKQFEEAYKQLDESLEKFKENIFGKVEEKAQEKFDGFMEQFETMKKELNEELSEKLELLAEKEKVDALKSELEDLKNTTKQRKSEVDESIEPNKNKNVVEPYQKKFGFKTLM